MKKIYLLSLAAVAALPSTLMAEIPEGYYDNLKGLSGADLKTRYTTQSRIPKLPATARGKQDLVGILRDRPVARRHISQPLQRP